MPGCSSVNPTVPAIGSQAKGRTNMVEISEGLPSDEELLQLYASVGWSAYTDDPARLISAIANSAFVFLARDSAGALVGLARVVSDRHTIAYIQDVLVVPQHRRTGIGGALLDAVLEHTREIRQTVLLTDDEPGQRAFYESRGFTEAHDHTRWPVRSFILFR